MTKVTGTTTPPAKQPSLEELEQAQADQIAKLSQQKSQVDDQYATLEKADPSQNPQLQRMRDQFNTSISTKQTGLETEIGQEKQLGTLRQQKAQTDTQYDDVIKSDPSQKAGLLQLKEQYDRGVSSKEGKLTKALQKEGALPTPPKTKPSAGTSPRKTTGKQGTGKAGGTKGVSTVPMPKSNNAFINAVAAGAVAGQSKTGVPASVTIAQAILESGWGKSTLATQGHNLFGIKGTGPAGSVTMPTEEYENGHYVTVNAQFRKYDNDAQSIEDHDQLLAGSPYYKKAMADKGNANQFAQDLTGVYATDPTYGKQLQQIMKDYNLYAYDDVGKKTTGTTPTKGTGTPPKTTAPSEPQLSSGSTGAAVKQLQTLLNKAGFNTHGVDGDFGPNTQAAVMSYQYSRGLPVDGVVGAKTWHDLQTNAPAEKKAPATGSGSSANTVAQRFLGQAESSLEFSHELPMDTWAPTTEDCANFASACLQVAGKIPGSQQTASVPTLYSELVKDGWKAVPLSQAKPGDVCCFSAQGAVPPSQLNPNNLAHVELFNNWNGSTPNFIGSNNILANGSQAISYDNGAYFLGHGGSVYVLQPPA